MYFLNKYRNIIGNDNLKDIGLMGISTAAGELFLETLLMSG